MDKTFGRTAEIDRVPELMSDLSDALEILYSCRRLAVPINDQFLDYIDTLIDRIEDARPYKIPNA